MEISFDFITFVHLAAVVLGIVSSAVLLNSGFRINPVNQPLGIGQLSISLAIFVGFSLVSQLIVHWPFLYRIGHIFALIFVPMPYLYTVFYTGKRLWRWYDLLHGLPLLIFIIDYWDVLSMSNAEKIIIIQQEIIDLDVLGEFRQGKFIGPGFHQEFRTVLFSAYWVAQVVILVRWIKSQLSFSPESKIWLKWMMLFLGYQFFIWFPFYLSIFWLDKLTTYQIVNSFSIVWLMLSSLSLFFFPSLLYGKAFVEKSISSKEIKNQKKIQITVGEERKFDELMRLIDLAMDNKMFFLMQGYSINDFSKDINIPVYQISKSLNTFHEMGFIDFINKKRVQYCVQKLEKGEWSNYTIEAVAHECGFNNRNSFTNAFKKFLGTSPSEFRGNLTK